jgi:hypothetical protein
MSWIRLTPALAVALGVAFACPAPAQTPAKPKQPMPEEIGKSQGWTAYTYADGGGKVCYLVAEPIRKEPANLRRGGVNALVTHNTADKTTNTISFVAGYAFAENAKVELDIDGRKFTLFTKNDTAWAYDSTADRDIVTAMVRGKDAVVKGTSSRNNTTTDTYSLAGFTAALQMIDKACNVRR